MKNAGLNSAHWVQTFHKQFKEVTNKRTNFNTDSQ